MKKLCLILITIIFLATACKAEVIFSDSFDSPTTDWQFYTIQDYILKPTDPWQIQGGKFFSKSRSLAFIKDKELDNFLATIHFEVAEDKTPNAKVLFRTKIEDSDLKYTFVADYIKDTLTIRGFVVISTFTSRGDRFIFPLGQQSKTSLSTGSGEYTLQLKSQDSGMYAKVWKEGEQEPDWQVFLSSPFILSGRMALEFTGSPYTEISIETLLPLTQEVDCQTHEFNKKKTIETSIIDEDLCISILPPSLGYYKKFYIYKGEEQQKQLDLSCDYYVCGENEVIGTKIPSTWSGVYSIVIYDMLKHDWEVFEFNV